MIAVGSRVPLPDAPSDPRRSLSAGSGPADEEVGAMLGTCCRLFKGVILYVALIVVVTLAAAAVGCLFLQGGDLRFFVHPDAMLNFLWAKRAGLKVTILFVATLIFFMLVEDGILSRRWYFDRGLGRLRRGQQAAQSRLRLRRRPCLSRSMPVRIQPKAVTGCRSDKA